MLACCRPNRLAPVPEAELQEVQGPMVARALSFTVSETSPVRQNGRNDQIKIKQPILGYTEAKLHERKSIFEFSTFSMT